MICCCRLAYFLLPWFVEPNFTEGAISEWSLLWVEVEPDLGERGNGVADSHGEVGAAVRRQEELGQAEGVAQRGDYASRRTGHV